VAPTLLGATLAHAGVTVRITEVEAYAGERDPASHAFRGRTARNGVMFGPPGHLYVYFSYGMHHACNVVCDADGTASGALIRAGEVLDGLDLARLRRGARITDRDLARGPGRLAQALGLTLADGGADVFGAGPARLVLGAHQVDEIASGPRVGVSAAADWPWRFWVAGDPFVSDYKRSPRAPKPTD
jgi:DNA-3-methyladenine glycosylase